MIIGAHVVLYAKDADAVRGFFRDTLSLRHVDAGEGWLIYALPPSELGVHPDEKGGRQELYLLCDDIEGTMRELEAKGVRFTKPILERGWGRLTALALPDGTEMFMYEPRHATTFKTPARASGGRRKGSARSAAKARSAKAGSATRGGKAKALKTARASGGKKAPARGARR